MTCCINNTNNTGVMYTSITPFPSFVSSNLSGSGTRTLYTNSIGQLTAGSINAGTGIGITGSGTSNLTINNSGVTSIIAGTNCTISPMGGTGAVTINAFTTPLPLTGPLIDISLSTTTTITASQLANCYIYSSALLNTTTQYNIILPSYSALIAQYGGQAVIPFTIGNFRTTTAVINFQGDSSIQIVSNFVGSNVVNTSGNNSTVLEVLPPKVGTIGWKLINGGFWSGLCILDPTNLPAYYSFSFQSVVILT